MHLPIVPQQKYEIHRKKTTKCGKNHRNLFSKFGKSLRALLSQLSSLQKPKEMLCAFNLVPLGFGGANRRKILPPSLPPKRGKQVFAECFPSRSGRINSSRSHFHLSTYHMFVQREKNSKFFFLFLAVSGFFYKIFPCP